MKEDPVQWNWGEDKPTLNCADLQEEQELHNLEFPKKYQRNLIEVAANKYPNLEIKDVCQLHHRNKVTIFLEVDTSEDGESWTVMVGLRNWRGDLRRNLFQEDLESTGEADQVRRIVQLI